MTAELESRLLYAVVVAGKSAQFAEQAMRRFYAGWHGTPFAIIREMLAQDCLIDCMRAAGTGNYRKNSQCFCELATSGLDLAACSVEDLEAIHGIGPKTSRFFVLWTRPNAPYAALDVHVLRWLRAQGYAAPKHTPTGLLYRRLEQAFLAEARKRGLTPRELDAQIWDAGSRYAESQITVEIESGR